MRDVGGVGLEGDRVAELGRGRQGLVQGGGRAGRDGGDAVVAEQGEEVGGGQRARGERGRPAGAARGIRCARWPGAEGTPEPATGAVRPALGCMNVPSVPL